MSRKNPPALATLRQLATLGLPGRAVLPQALELVRALVDHELAVSIFVDPGHRIEDALIPATVPLDLLQHYAGRFYNHPGGDGVTGMTSRQLFESDARILSWSRFTPRSAWTNTPLWNEVFRPLGQGWGCNIALRDGRRPIANLGLSRPFSLPDFTDAELELLAQAQPWLSHALARNGAPTTAETMEAADSAMILLDTSGRIQSASPGALLLLHQAVESPLVPRSDLPAPQTRTAALLRRLAGAATAGLAGAGASPPFWHTRHGQGEFHLRAYALDAFTPGQRPGVSLHIERRLPTRLLAFRSPRFLSLTLRERDVCLGLLAGQGRSEIAQRLGIQPSSVIQHTRSLYRRLGINGREELATALG